MCKKWGCVLEVGAGWVTKSNYSIFNINDYSPQEPLNNGREWHNSRMQDDKISMTNRNINMFVDRILTICTELGYSCESIDKNIAELKLLVELI